MQKYTPSIHNRRSIRLHGYDYTQAGLYFITICSQDGAYLFGEVENSQMKLNAAGEMLEKWYYELANKFSDIKCDEMVIMPNHIHFIIENVGANLCVRPTDNEIPQHIDILGAEGEHAGSPLHNVVKWFKTMTTNEYIRNVKNTNWPRFNGKLWQRNYYECIIRDEIAYQNISNYIINNPAKWQRDKSNPHL
jgi:putative transposase